jgi:acyl carrier protein phosphodiesterase
MNFLAHIHLSGENDDIKIGNFIADSVRTKDLPNFTEDIQLGIKLHWAIDNFTDHHEVVKKSKALLYDEHHKYGAVLVDIFYDHYLARDWANYSNEDLGDFVNYFYQLLKDRKEELPERITQMLPYMIRYNWLYNYQFLDGIEKVLGGMGRRASFKNRMHLGTNALKEHYETFGSHFKLFYPALEAFVKNKKEEFLSER